MAVSVDFHPFEAGEQLTGALDIALESRRVISVPTQLGCKVGCTFCVSSKTALSRNLRASEIAAMARQAQQHAPEDGRPIELSFTGEGEGLMNLRETRAAALEVAALHPGVKSVRYSSSGLGAAKLLGQVPTEDFPTRLQFSLHAARQELRDRMVPNSSPLDEIRRALTTNARRFSAIELNVVLQDGVNDSDEDLRALAGWGDSTWPILLNPVLADGKEVVARRTEHFETHLRAAGRTVKRYSAVAAGISRNGIYPQLTARPAPAAIHRLAFVARPGAARYIDDDGDPNTPRVLRL